MSTPLSKLDRFKLETTFGDGFVVNATINWKLSTMHKQLSTWRKQKLLGSGGFGNVWLEKDDEAGQLRAVKILERQVVVEMTFAHELLALITLAHHKHLFVEFYGWYENEKHIFIAMEYIEHGDLAQYISGDQENAKRNAREITKQVLEGLEVLHGERICHRDLKPQNVLIASRDPLWIKIADFGTSKRSLNTALRTICGTQGYIAPELIGLIPKKLGAGELQVFSYALDMWSLGCMVHELLTFQPPFNACEDSAVFESGLTAATVGSEVNMALLYPYCQGTTDFPTDQLQMMHVTEQGINFVKSLLAAQPEKRATAARALRDPWLADTGYISDWHENLLNECAELEITLELGDRNDKTLLRRIRLTDVATNFRSETENLTMLMGRALENGKYTVASVLMNSAARSSEDRSGSEWTKLYERAVEGGHVRWLKLLLSDGRDVSSPSFDGLTALEVAVAKGYTEVVEMLLNHHAAVNTPSNEKHQPLQIAIEKGYTEIAKLLLANKADVHSWVGSRTALLAAVDAGDFDIVKLLLDNGADSNAAEKECTVLQTSWYAGMIDQILDLDVYLHGNLDGEHDSHPDSMRATVNGRTALQTAAEQGYTSIVELLLVNKADVNAPPAGKDGLTALQGAASNGHQTIVDLLLGNKADVNAKSSLNGRTALQGAVCCGNAYISKQLLVAGADVNAPSSGVSCGTALQIAIETGNAAIVEQLLARGANSKAKTSRGTLLQIAIQKKHTEIVKLLSDHIAATGALFKERVATAADVMVVVVLLFGNLSDFTTEVSEIRSEVAPWTFTNMASRGLLNLRFRSNEDLLWKALLGFVMIQEQRRLPGWRAVIRTTLLKSVISLIMTNGAHIKTNPHRYKTSSLYYLESCVVSCVKMVSVIQVLDFKDIDDFLQKTKSRDVAIFLANPLAVMIIRLIFIIGNAPSVEGISRMESLSAPFAEMLVDLPYPGWQNMKPPTNFFRQRALGQIFHLWYAGFKLLRIGQRLREVEIDW